MRAQGAWLGIGSAILPAGTALQCGMPAQRVLFVKLSSLGDVVHHMPAVTDLAGARPGVHVAWAVEEAYAELVRLHPAVAEIFPVSLRALRKSPLSPAKLTMSASVIVRPGDSQASPTDTSSK